MELFDFSDEIFEQQDCLCFSKFSNSIKTELEKKKNHLNSQYSSIKKLTVNRMAIIKESFSKFTYGDTAHY